jgi:hypothetical protein
MTTTLADLTRRLEALEGRQTVPVMDIPSEAALVIARGRLAGLTPLDALINHLMAKARAHDDYHQRPGRRVRRTGVQIKQTSPQGRN